MDDRISSLSDEILCQILSFLPTEDVFATSVLSKRWEPLCHLVPTVDIDQHRFEETGKSYYNFNKMVDRILSPQNGLHNRYIKKICIKCNSISFYTGFWSTPFEKFLTAASEHGMEYLDLCLGSSRSLCFIFSYKTLVILKLKKISFDMFSIDVEHASLKILHLFNVHFNYHWYLAELLNGCPILEEFEAKDLTLLFEPDPRDTKFKKLPMLMRADINNTGPFCDIPPLVALCNAKFLRLEQVHAELVMFSNLTHLELFFERIEIEFWFMVWGMLKNSPKLQTILLDKPKLLGLVFWYKFQEPRSVPICFSSQFRKCTITNYNRHDLGFVKYIIQNSKSLQSMTLYTPPSLDPFEKIEILNELFSSTESSPTCEIIFV